MLNRANKPTANSTDRTVSAEGGAQVLAEAMLAVREAQPGNLHFGSPTFLDAPVNVARAILAAMPDYKIVPADEPRDWPGHTCNFGDGDNCEACDAASQRLREAVDEPNQVAAGWIDEQGDERQVVPVGEPSQVAALADALGAKSRAYHAAVNEHSAHRGRAWENCPAVTCKFDRELLANTALDATEEAHP